VTDDQDRLEVIRHRYWNTSVPYPQDRGHLAACAWMRQADTDLGQLLLLVDAQASQIEAAATNAQDLIAVNDALRVAYRAAVGVPPSEHQIRRLEAMAQRLEECQAELRRLKGEVTA
jgi:hypothetical protein